jgi:hypothetical protein
MNININLLLPQNEPNPLTDGMCLKFITLHVRIYVVLIEVTIVEHVDGSIELIEKHTKLVDILTTNNKVKPFEFLFTNLPLTPP